MPNQNSQQPVFEYIFEQKVQASKVDRYHVFSEKLRELVTRQPGFIDLDRQTVEQGETEWRFRTTLRFDTAEHCIAYLDNSERRRILNQEEEEAGFAFKGHGNWDGYSRWLSRSITGEPPKWKVNLLVLLTLYPTAMLLTPLLHNTLVGYRGPTLMLISNALCVAATSWILVPFASRVYARWLEGKCGILSFLTIILLFVLMLYVFLAVPASFWG